MKRLSLLLTLLAAVMLASCAAKRPAAQEAAETIANTGSQRALRHAIIYRMAGDYADLVPVTLDSTGTCLVSYPDPVDVRPSSRPEPLIDGWYLDHRGVGLHTAFLSYTYDEYHALPAVPSQDELMAHILVRRGVSEVRDLGTGQTRDSILALLRAEQR